jgi:hypothetical protein
MRPKQIEAGALGRREVGYSKNAGQNGARDNLLGSELGEPFRSLSGGFVVHPLEGVDFAIRGFALNRKDSPIVKTHNQVGAGIA